MNHEDTCVFRKFQKRLIRHADHNRFIDILILHNIFSEQRANDILTALKSEESVSRLLTCILLELPQHCSSKNFLKVLKYFDKSLYHRYQRRLRRKEVEKSSKVIAIGPPKHNTTATNNNFIDRFHELLKAKTRRAGDLRWKREFETWACRLTQRLQAPGLPFSEKSKIADCTYVLLDLTAVLEKQHEPNKAILASSTVFDRMESIIQHTTDPTLYRLTFFARKGVALAQAGDLQSALDHAKMVLQDSAHFTSGRQIGNSIYAVVNILLQHYASLPSSERRIRGNELKKEILFWIETGIKHFENENEDMRKTWRRVYLDKKVFCHLGIDILSQDIPDVEITEEDVKIATTHLIEMENLKQGMENLRLIHYYVAEAKLHTLRNEPPISKGYLTQALEIGKVGHYMSEVKIINNKLNGHDAFGGRNQDRQPTEHDEEPIDTDDQQTMRETSLVESRTPCENAETLEPRGACSMDVNEMMSRFSLENQDPNMNATCSDGDLVDKVIEKFTKDFILDDK